MLDEVEDRHRRRRNLIFSGIREQTNVSMKEKRQTQNICIRFLRVYRYLRRRRRRCIELEDLNCLIKVRFDNEKLIRKSYENARNLRNVPQHKTVVINSDLAAAQRRDRKALRK